MTQIICRAMNCLFWENGVCGSEEIEYEPDAGCLTFQDMGDLDLEEEDDEDFDWEDEEEEEEEEEDLFEDEDADDLFSDDW
jgi:hypothetical protein